MREYQYRESGSVDLVTVEEALPEIHRVLGNNEYKDIYNMDETGI